MATGLRTLCKVGLSLGALLAVPLLNMKSASAAPDEDLQLISFPTSANGQSEHVIALASSSNIFSEWTHTSAGGWRYQPFVIEPCNNDVSPPSYPGTALTGFYLPTDGTDHIFFIGNDEHVHERFWADNSTGCFTDRDVTAQSGAPLPYLTVTNGTIALTGLTGIVDSINTMHVFFAAQGSSNITEMYYWSGRWWWGSPGGQAQVYVGGGIGTAISSLWDGSVEHIYYLGTDSQTHEDYYNGNWWSHALTGTQGAVNPKQAWGQFSIASSIDNGQQLIWGAGLGGTSAMIGLEYSAGYWGSYSIPAPKLVGSSNTIASFNGTVFYVGSDQQIYDPNESQSSLQSQAGGALVGIATDGVSLTPLTGFTDSAGYQRVLYAGTDEDLHEYYSNGGNWVADDVTAITGHDYGGYQLR
jgi:hypothetical protein